MLADEFTFSRHEVPHMWKLSSHAARKYWTPILGPTTAAMADVVGDATRHGAVTMTADDLMLRLGVRKRDVIATSVHRAVVYLGAIPKFGEGPNMELSYPSGVYPPGAQLRQKFSAGLAQEFDAYLTKVQVTLSEARKQSAGATPVKNAADGVSALDASLG